MISKKDIVRVDSSKMYEVYDKWPEIAKKAFETKFKQINFQNVNHVVFAGMGGSGTIGDFFYAILSKKNLHVEIVKGYLLPKTVTPNSLIITTSISGNTIETLTILNSAKKSGCKIIAFSSGGEMEKICIKHKIEFRKIEKFHSPRASFVSFLFSMLKILNPILEVKNENIKNSIKELEKIKKNISSKNLKSTNESLSLARYLDEIPIIYYPWGLQTAAIRFKNSLQENAKIHAMVEDIVEASHNGIVAWETKSKIKPVLLQGKDDFKKTKERWKIFENYLKDKKIKIKKIKSVDGDILSKLIVMIYLLDYASIYLSVIRNIDPTPVKAIEYIKLKIDKKNDF